MKFFRPRPPGRTRVEDRQERYSDSRFVNAEALASPLAFIRIKPDWLCFRLRGMEDCYRIPQRNCGRISRPSLGLLVGLTRLAPDACHAKELTTFLGLRGWSVNPLAKKSRTTLNDFMRNLHAWTHRTEEGEKREVRAVKNQGRWKLQSKLKHEEEWTYHEKPERSDLTELRDILWRKYQRRRASHEDVLLADKMLAELAPAD